MARMVTNYSPQVDGLALDLDRTMVFIDDALDRRDRRSFRMWSMKHRSLSGRLASLLVKIVTAHG